MREGSSDRATIADLIVRNMGNRFAQKRMGGRDVMAFKNITPADQRANPQLRRTDFNRLQFSYASNIDQDGGCQQSIGHHRNETLAAGEDLAVPLAFDKQPHGVFDAFCLLIADDGQFQ